MWDCRAAIISASKCSNCRGSATSTGGTCRQPCRYHRHPSSSRPIMQRSYEVLPTGIALLLVGVTLACGGARSVGSTESVAPAASTLDRMTVRTGEQVVVVDSPVGVGRRIERMVVEAGGYIERSTGSKNGNVRMEGRVPAAQLEIGRAHV